MRWMRRWRRRVVTRRPYLKPPAAMPEERLEEARQAAESADAIHSLVLEMKPVVEAEARKSERIHRENNLGPSFWRAMEGRRA